MFSSAPVIRPRPVEMQGEVFSSVSPLADPSDLKLSHRVRQCSNSLDPNAYHITGFKKVSSCHAHSSRCAGEDQIPRIQRDSGREMADLFSDGENHLTGVRVLLEDVIDPKLEAQVLRVHYLPCWYDPGADRAGPVEAFLTHPVVLERRGVGDLRTG
jgi:hypothetical protein